MVSFFNQLDRVLGHGSSISIPVLGDAQAREGSDLWRDRERFKKFTHASLELCKVYMELFSCTGGRRELLAADMHLRNTIKQARHEPLILKDAGNFSESEEFKDLQACLNEVQLKLQAGSAPSA
ncbi:hypothetical protein U1Q18_018544 [Sarracenia purpurea var. burkii]